MIRLVVIFLAGCGLAMAQPPIVSMRNLSRPVADFQVGDRFEITVVAGPHQPISVRTTRLGSGTDWGPVIASTDAIGRWSTKGSFEKADFGYWKEVWTVGGKVANPVVSFDVGAPCIQGGQGFMFVSGPNIRQTCDTPGAPQQMFATPSLGDSFRAPDGRVVAGENQSNQSAEEYHLKIMQEMVEGDLPSQPVQLAAEAGDLIAKLIGVNALTDKETRNALAIVRSAYAPLSQFRATEAQKPSMVALLERLADGAEEQGLRDEVASTIEFVRRQ